MSHTLNCGVYDLAECTCGAEEQQHAREPYDELRKALHSEYQRDPSEARSFLLKAADELKRLYELLAEARQT